MEQFAEFVGNHLFLFSLLVGILALLVWNLFGNTLSGIEMPGPMEVTRMINHEKAVVLDIRKDEDYSEGHILNAVNIPLDKLDEQADKLKKYRDRPVIITCRQGTESTRAARILKSREFEKLYCLKGGIQAWRNANLPLSRETGSKKS